MDPERKQGLKKASKLLAPVLIYCVGVSTYHALHPQMPRRESYLILAPFMLLQAWFSAMCFRLLEAGVIERGVNPTPYRVCGWGACLTWAGLALFLAQTVLFGRPGLLNPGLVGAVSGILVMVVGLLWVLPDAVRYYVRRWRAKCADA